MYILLALYILEILLSSTNLRKVTWYVVISDEINKRYFSNSGQNFDLNKNLF